jgi:acylphosphatase
VRNVREGSGAGVICRFNAAAVRLTIHGAVQSVGFHPFAYGPARALGLSDTALFEIDIGMLQQPDRHGPQAMAIGKQEDHRIALGLHYGQEALELFLGEEVDHAL